ncbi:ATP-binding protein [Ramlibacter sp.]|uniref:ATP-binding protein n=1 Tax=Ramlibacter sp. TaxID=1917967 RepID=UPI002C2F96F7|nr:ATP-binding protein [Ramlibacter sp.]HWI80766.1 ATP-binding protein [Ramlibacter sp.]
MRRPQSLQGRLLALVLGLVLLVWASTSVMTWVDARHELDELLDSHLAQAAALLVVQQADLEEAHDVDAPSLHRYAPKVAFQVFHDGRLVLRSANAPAWPMAAGDRLQQGFRTVSVDGTAWRVFATHGAERDVQVYVGEQVASRASILRAVLRSTSWPMLVALPLLALAVWWAVAQGLAPLRRLGRTLAERPAHDLQPVRIADAPSEMTPLLAALDGLLARIAELLQSERRFTADAAHELRTPIAAIRAQAQVALGEPDDTLRRHALESTLAGCDRAARLVEQLLTLSRLEAESPGPRQRTELAPVVQRAVAEVAPRAVGKQQAIELDAAPGCVVAGDEALLQALARNLVDNAVRYSPRGARVQVRVARDGARIVLEVQDSGPGLDQADRQRLGQRFFRVPGSEESGSGLGWSIVRRIAAAHGAEVSLQRSPALGGLAVRVAFAAAEGSSE